MNLYEAQEILNKNGYFLKESEADIFMEVEDELENYGLTPNEIAQFMQDYDWDIAELIEKGNSPEEIVEKLLG